MSTHKVLLVPRRVGGAGALLQEGVGDLVVDVLLLNHVVVGEMYIAVQILQPGRLAKPYELVVDEAILDVVEVMEYRNFMEYRIYVRTTSWHLKP